MCKRLFIINMITLYITYYYGMLTAKKYLGLIAAILIDDSKAKTAVKK